MVTVKLEALITSNRHSVKSVRIRSFSCPYFPAFGLNTERYEVSLRIQSECRKTRTRKTPNTDTFYAVRVFVDQNMLQFFFLYKEGAE